VGGALSRWAGLSSAAERCRHASRRLQEASCEAQQVCAWSRDHDAALRSERHGVLLQRHKELQQAAAGQRRQLEEAEQRCVEQEQELRLLEEQSAPAQVRSACFHT